MIATFIQQYWFGILLVCAVLIYTWYVVGRARELSAVEEPEIDRELTVARDRFRRQPAAMRIAVGVGAFALIVATRYSSRVALVQTAARDYLVVAIIGGVIGFLIVRRLEALRGRARPDLGVVAVGMIVAAGATASVLLLANALLDAGPAREFTTVAATPHCGGRISDIEVRGAPVLPVEADTTLRVNVGSDVCRSARAGDTVIVVIRPGFFGRRWIQRARLTRPGSR
jgi:hypothetical protein